MALSATLLFYFPYAKSGAGVTGKSGSLAVTVKKLVRSASPTITTVTTGGAITVGSVTEIDATHNPGVYVVGVSGLDPAADYQASAHYTGTASDVDAVDVPSLWSEFSAAINAGAVPQVAAAADGGLPTVDDSNNVHGLAQRTCTDASVIMSAGAVTLAPFFTGTATGGTPTSIVIGMGPNATDDDLVGCNLLLTGGTGASDRLYPILSSIGSPCQAFISSAGFIGGITPDSSTTFAIYLAAPVTVSEWLGNPVAVDANNVPVVSLAAVQPNYAPAKPADILATPGQPIATDASGRVTVVPGSVTGATLAASQSFNNTGQTTPYPAIALPAASGIAPSPGTPALSGTSVYLAINYPFVQPFTISGLDSTGWTQIVWTVKAKPIDADSAALIAIKLSNPGSGSDGLITLNGAVPSGATSASDGSITGVSITGNTNLTINLTARGTAIVSGSDFWELTIYKSSGKTSWLGSGALSAAQTLRVNPVTS